MRVLFFTHVALPQQGGVEYKNHHLANALADRGIEVVHLSPGRRDPSGIMDRLPRRYRQQFYWLPPTRAPLDSWLAGLYLRRLKRKYECDILLASMAYPCGYWATRVKRQLRVPVVIITEAADVQERSDLAGIFQTQRYRTMVRQALGLADAVTALGDATASNCLQRGADPARLRVIGNGVDFEGIRRARPARRPRPYVLTVTRPQHVKGVDVLLHAFRAVGETFPDLDLVICGVPPGGQHQELALNLGLADRVSFEGTVIADEKHALLSGCELFVLPSRGEAFPLVVLEAMAAARALVVTDVGCVPEIVAHGQSGLVVPPGHVDALAEAMVRLLESSSLRRALGMHGAEVARQYSWSRIADRYVELFEELLGAGIIAPRSGPDG